MHGCTRARTTPVSTPVTRPASGVPVPSASCMGENHEFAAAGRSLSAHPAARRPISGQRMHELCVRGPGGPIAAASLQNEGRSASRSQAPPGLTGVRPLPVVPRAEQPATTEARWGGGRTVGRRGRGAASSSAGRARDSRGRARRGTVCGQPWTQRARSF